MLVNISGDSQLFLSRLHMMKNSFHSLFRLIAYVSFVSFFYPFFCYSSSQQGQDITLSKLLIVGFRSLLTNYAYNIDVAKPSDFTELDIEKSFIITFYAGGEATVRPMVVKIGSCYKDHCYRETCHKLNRHKSDEAIKTILESKPFQQRLADALYAARHKLTQSMAEGKTAEDNMLTVRFLPGKGITVHENDNFNFDEKDVASAAFSVYSSPAF